MYGHGGGFNPHFRHAAPPPPPPLSQQPLPPPPPRPQAGVTAGFLQQSLPPPPPLAQYPQTPAMRPPPGQYQHGMLPHQNQAYPYAHLGQMHHMPMLPHQRGFGHMQMPGPPQAMYQPPPQYPMPVPLPPPPPRPPSIAPDNLPPPPPPPSSPPLMPPSPPAAPATAESCAETEGKEGATDGGHEGKSEKEATELIVSDDSDMDMGGDEDSPSRVHLSVVNSSPAAAECSGDNNTVNVPKAVNDMSNLGSDLAPGSSGKAKTGNVSVEAGSQLHLIQQDYASDDSEDEEEHTRASSNPLLPEDNEPNQSSDINTEIGHQQVTYAEENVNAAPCLQQNYEPRMHQLKDERSPINHNSDEPGQPVTESLSGSESAGRQHSERHGRIQTKRIRSQSPIARRSCSPSGENKHSPSQSSSHERQTRSPLAKRANLHQSKSPHHVSLLPGQPPVASSEPHMQFQPNAMAPSNDFLQNQIRTYPAPDLSHPRPLDFHPHAPQPALPSQQQPAAFHNDEFKSPFSLDNAPVLLPDGRPEFSAGVGLSYSSHQSSYNQQQPPPGSLASGANIAYPSFQIFPSNLPGSSDLGPVPISDIVLPKSSIKPHYNPFASTFETDPTLDISPIQSPNAVESASAKAVELMNTTSPFGQSVPGSGTRFNESSAEVVPSRQKQPCPGFTPMGPYDPLLDSIEPSSNSINKMDLGQEANLSATGSRNASKLVNIEVESKNMHGLGLVAESEVVELGEVAADTETGVVENVSPEPLGAKDWSSDIPGDIDNDQSLDVSKKSKDSRSMKLFKVAIADFVKEVLKPSWRQGNMSREAFKMIVKKTVDKVSSSVPGNHIPKTPAKIRQYVQSSQRKVTKLVMGYVDKYVKL
ncbi:YLP motif-containing protein 1-like [Triticum dicoccoides]|nr:YLP motif-containing protein 1-like [Triticum dicoccoides]XP_044323967.1 YLP motif-containing protein 1-like [Triticum aestivum]